MRYPVEKVYITQRWGINKDYYSRWGLNGHNGIDLRVFDEDGKKASKGKVFAPHSGVVKEAYFDKAYGKYLKIENNKWGSIIAHLDKFNVKVGDSVREGDFIAISDNTGNSSGPHVHWGLYPKPRNRNNGYSGTIDPTPILEEKQEKKSKLDICLEQHTKLLDKIKSQEEDYKDLEKDYDDLLKEKGKLKKDLNKQIENLETKLKSKKKEVNNTKKIIQSLKADKKQIQTELNELNNQFEKIADILGSTNKTSDIIGNIERLLNDTESYKKQIIKAEKQFALMESEKETTIKELKEEIQEQQIKLEKLSSQNNNLLTRVEQLEEQTKKTQSFFDIIRSLFK